jgi:hypothetical protein
MTAHKIRAVAAAFLLSTAAIGAGVLATGPAYAAGVRPEIGTPLLAAQADAAKGDYKAAMENVNKAEAVSNKTPEESQTIAQMKQYIGAKSGDVSLGGAAAARTKIVNDYNSKNYAGVLSDADALRKSGALDSSMEPVVAQSYYLSGNKAGCVKYIKGLGTSDETLLQLEMKCAYDVNDDATQRDVLEELVSRTANPKYWIDLLKLAQAKKLSDPQTLQIYRLKYLTGAMAGKDDYTVLAQLDMQFTLPSEALTVLNKGATSLSMNDDRTKKLMGIATQQAATVKAGLPAALAAANKDPGGDALAKVALQQWSMDDAKSAVDTAKSAMAKPLKDKDTAVITLGLAQIGAGQSADAVKTLNADKGDGNGPMIAHLYALYAAHPGGAVAEAAPSKPSKPTKKKR